MAFVQGTVNDDSLYGGDGHDSVAVDDKLSSGRGNDSIIEYGVNSFDESSILLV